MTLVKDLYRRLEATPFPRMGGIVGDFLLYDSILAGYASRLAKGAPVDEVAADLEADHGTLQTVAALRAKKGRTEEEQEFLDYFDLLEEIRTVVLAAARDR
jgi:hypothetical protein